ncbi:monocarboxylate transporter 12-B-like [Thalassophryne amazonica]|uniref:monocarboxylate transporter 12-B-like n=1 Tax=Thalassophryne amazonica TaxID=390379 RepID=UPI001471B489|nr:monocarboxylate transporter 12-B-like [Thalassophryne amazonica]
MPDGRRQHSDGGWAWVIVGCCFMVMVCTRAVTRCISIFFVEFQSAFEANYATTAWIHSLVNCTTMLCAPVGSLVGNRWSCRVAVVLGGLLSSCGLLLSSFTTTLELLYFSMGILTGVGFALCYTPAIAIVGSYFKQRNALAYGIAMSGRGIGTFVWMPVVQLLIDCYSWRGALLILSAFVANICVCGALLRPATLQQNQEAPEGAGQPGEEECIYTSPPPLLAENPALYMKKTWRFRGCVTSCRDDYSFLLLPDFVGLAVSILFLAGGCILPFVYLVPYAVNATVSHQNAAFLMSILGIISIDIKITFPASLSCRCLKSYRLMCYILSVGMEGRCCLCVPLLRSFPLLVSFAVLYGYCNGAYVALTPVVTSKVVGEDNLSAALGVVYFLHAIPFLVTPPTGGWLVDVTGSYTATFFLSGATLLASALILFTVIAIRRCHSVNLKPESPSHPA